MRTVILSILATAFSGTAKEESNYKRLQRFLREFEMPYAKLALLIVKLLGVPEPYTLTMDRMDWKVGTLDVNVLMLSVVYLRIEIPMVWIILSNTDECGIDAPNRNPRAAHTGTEDADSEIAMTSYVEVLPMRSGNHYRES